MAMGWSGSKGGISKSKKIVSENSVILFKEIIKINNGKIQNGNGFFRK